MDLNVIIQDCGPRDPDHVIEQKLIRCKMMGFNAVALSVIIDITNDHPPQVPAPPDLKALCPSQLKVYSRLTAKVSDSMQLFKLGKCKEKSQYDLLALEPQNAKILQYISVGSAELDILTFNLADRLDFNLFRIGYKVLEERGVCFEINYGPAQQGSAMRRNIICNGQNLTEKTTKNLILSSGVSDEFRMRSPKDAKCLGVLFLLTTSKCHDAVFKNATKAINQSKHRKDPTSSAIELVIDD